MKFICLPVVLRFGTANLTRSVDSTREGLRKMPNDFRHFDKWVLGSYVKIISLPALVVLPRVVVSACFPDNEKKIE